ncbi:hypothetical protein [Streptomyces sp. CoH27]|uniref:hypothetical protein n=1 Tax=Streptomyces sp. CoH27 TaxID=2875763 RepID=UPI001CD1E7F6|nr:hypothetical protein [Streptomyces sp. CoH27]
MNTRGLTEIVVLRAGYSAHILTPGLCLALLAMALATTACSGPLPVGKYRAGSRDRSVTGSVTPRRFHQR